MTSMLLTTFAFGQNTISSETKTNYETSRVKTDAANRYVEDLSRKAETGAIQFILGLETETEKVAAALAVKDKKGTIVVDRYGTKRGNVIENLAALSISEGAPAGLRGKRILKINPAQIVADSTDEENLNARLSGVIAFAKSFGSSAVVFVEDFSSFSQENPLFGNQVAAKLRDALSTENIKFISGGAIEDYDSQAVSDNFLKRNFRKINLNEEAKNSEDAFVGDKISPDLRNLMASAAPDEKVKVILQSDDIDNPELNKILQSNGVAIAGRADNLNMLVVDLPVRAAEAVAAARSAKHLSLDQTLKVLGHIDTTTGVLAARAQAGNSTLDGRGIGIAIVDSAIFEGHHAFLGNDGNKRIAEIKEFVTGGKEDKFGHGTHVAALAAGRGGKPGDNNSIAVLKNYQGIAPESKIIAVRALDNEGRGSTAKLIEALNWIYANRTRHNIRVVNLSLGTAAVETWRNDPVCRAVRTLTSAGVVVVAAAGNNGKDAAGNKIYGAIHAPGNDPTVITVGAVNTFGTDARNDDGIATYSSRGPTRSFYTEANGVKKYDHLIKPDLVAPGNKLIAAKSKDNLFAEENPQLDITGDGTNDSMQLLYLSGTSMATPIVSGAAALLLQANPKLTPNMVKMILQYTAQPLAGFNHLEQGAGSLNVEGAVRLAKLVRQDLTSDTSLGT
ncbi:MAG TPA: S8 family serine peptidase, partial [Pyrinomonadaceae bacterium]